MEKSQLLFLSDQGQQPAEEGQKINSQQHPTKTGFRLETDTIHVRPNTRLGTSMNGAKKKC